MIYKKIKKRQKRELLCSIITALAIKKKRGGGGTGAFSYKVDVFAIESGARTKEALFVFLKSAAAACVLMSERWPWAVFF